MPFCSAAASAFDLMSSSLMSFAASSSVSVPHRLGDRHLLLLAPPAAHLREHALDLARQLFHARRRHDLHLLRQRRDVDLDLLVVERALAQHLAESLPRRGVGRLHVVEIDLAHRRQQHVEHALLGSVGGAVAHLARLRLARLLDGHLDQVADDGVDVAADIADFGELGRLDLHERRVGEPREAPRDLGLADAGRTDQQDVLRRDLLPQRLGDLLAAPAVAQRNRDRALGGVLPDDVLVELVDDLFGGHLGRHARGAGATKAAVSRILARAPSGSSPHQRPRPTRFARARKKTASGRTPIAGWGLRDGNFRARLEGLSRSTLASHHLADPPTLAVTRQGTKRFAQCPACGGDDAIDPPRGTHWSAGSAAPFSTWPTMRSKARCAWNSTYSSCGKAFL